MDLLAVVSGVGHEVVRLNAESEALFQINLFQVLIAAANFVVFLAIIWKFAFNPVAKMLADRKARIEEGLRDAEQARRDRESAESERVAALQVALVQEGGEGLLVDHRFQEFQGAGAAAGGKKK